MAYDGEVKTYYLDPDLAEARDALRRARELLSDQDHWIKGREAQNEYGIEVLANSEHARSFCLIGAVRRVTLFQTADSFSLAPRTYVRALELLASAIRARSSFHSPLNAEALWTFNDSDDRTHEDVLQMLDAAIG